MRNVVSNIERSNMFMGYGTIHIPIVIGTCTLVRIVNVIKEGEVDWLSMSWVVARASSLLSW